MPIIQMRERKRYNLRTPLTIDQLELTQACSELPRLVEFAVIFFRLSRGLENSRIE